MPDFSWYVRRLQAMSPEEIVHRTRMEFRKASWRRQASADGDAPATTLTINWSKMDRTPYEPKLPKDSPEVQRLIEEADAYMNHEWFYGGMSGIKEETIDWHCDPDSGILAPMKFGFDINHRDEKVVGNIKFTWEKNRHHHLNVLAIAYVLTGDEKYSAEVADQLLSWIEQNPYLVGVNWTHPLEQGIRLIAWLWCERLLRTSAHYERAFGNDSPIWLSIYQHQEFIEKTYSRGSSANNHLIGEMAGLFAVAVAYPIFDESAKWEALSRKVLEAEAVKQTFGSGVNRELAFSYHIFALEFFLLAMFEAERTSKQFTSTYRSIMLNMFEVMPHLTDYGRNLPQFGDGDEGMAIQLQNREERRDSWLYRVGRAMLNANVPVPAEGELASSVLGFTHIPDAHWEHAEQSLAYVDAGLYLLTSKRGTDNEVFVLTDAGPHGYLSITAHAHADALSFAMSVGGKKILVDTGTFAYHTDEYWRKYFRGTSAHNTVMVDNLDQSTQQGAFLWTQKAETTVHKWQSTANGGELVASHDGYERLGVKHQRTLNLDGNNLTINDHMDGTESHDVAVLFHVAPECTVEKVSDTEVEITRDNIRVRMALPANTVLEIVKGGECAGWYSPEFGVKHETHTIIATIKHHLPLSLTTELEII